MKKILCFILIVSSIPAHALRDDLKKHFGVSYGMAFVGSYACEKVFALNEINNFWCALGSSLTIGVAKEIYDSEQNNNHFDNDDLTFDAAGALFGATTYQVINEWGVSFETNGKSSFMLNFTRKI